jgi:hypothetical protein
VSTGVLDRKCDMSGASSWLVSACTASRHCSTSPLESLSWLPHLASCTLNTLRTSIGRAALRHIYYHRNASGGQINAVQCIATKC